MSRFLFWAVTLPLLSIALTASTSRAVEPWQGKVVKVADGDTVTVLDGNRRRTVRFFGIDSPESKQRFGDVATDFTTQALLGQIVEVEPVNTHFKRVICKVRLNGEDFCELLVQEGMAWWYQRYAPKCQNLAQAEKSARAARRGLWIDDDPVPPWIWRQQNRWGILGNVVPSLLRAIGRRSASATTAPGVHPAAASSTAGRRPRLWAGIRSVLSGASIRSAAGWVGRLWSRRRVSRGTEQRQPPL